MADVRLTISKTMKSKPDNALDEFDEWLHEEYEQSGDDETILHIMVRLDEIRTKYNV